LPLTTRRRRICPLRLGRLPTRGCIDLQKSTINDYLFNKTRYADNAIWTEINLSRSTRIRASSEALFLAQPRGISSRPPAPASNYGRSTITILAASPNIEAFLLGGDFLLGFWGEDASPNRRRSASSSSTSHGRNAQFRELVGAREDDDSEFYSPFMQYTQTYNATTFSAACGCWSKERPPCNITQDHGTAGGVLYGRVRLRPKPDPNATVAARYFYEWLPNLGVRQQLVERMERQTPATAERPAVPNGTAERALHWRRGRLLEERNQHAKHH